jgi:hypothetical protein
MLSRIATRFALFFVVVTVWFQGSALSGPRNPVSQSNDEVMLSAAGNAYNPVPSPDGSKIAYVHTGWDRFRGSGGFGRSNLLSEVMVMNSEGKVITPKPLADAFLVGWISDGQDLVCFRDYLCFLVSLDAVKSKEARMALYHELYKRGSTERATYCGFLDAMCWVGPADDFDYIMISGRRLARDKSAIGDMLVPSPDGRYIAAFGSYGEAPLWIYDSQKDSWTDLGKITVHPNRDWDYIKPSWTPWFRDSSRLVFISDGGLVISSPDRKSQQRIMPLSRPAGLPVASPDGHWIAYVTFDPTPRDVRPDLLFWGGTTIWVVAAERGAKPRAATRKAAETTCDLSWVNYVEVVFDRIGPEAFYSNSHIWKARVLSH